jgi:hypothetical protein
VSPFEKVNRLPDVMTGATFLPFTTRLARAISNAVEKSFLTAHAQPLAKPEDKSAISVSLLRLL